MKRIFLALIALAVGLFLVNPLVSQIDSKSFKDKMLDPKFNFYNVCEQADNYFMTHERGKGSGYKAYQRWKALNEANYYPSGDRSQININFSALEFEKFLNSGSRNILQNGWEELGPVIIDSITGHYSPGLGRIETFYVNPNNEQQIYLGSRSGGFWKTNNGGQSWQGGSCDTLIATGVNTLTVSPTNSDSIFINIRNSKNGYSHGIFQSIDGGDSWFPSEFNPGNLGFGGLGDNFLIRKVAYHPSIDGLLFVCTDNGLYRSDDHLNTWSLIFSGDISEIEFHPADPNTMYVFNRSNYQYVMVSNNAGLTFFQSSSLSGNSTNAGSLATSAACPNCVFFGSGNGIWKSIDNGLTFNFVSEPDETSRYLVVGDQNEEAMIIGGIDAFFSSDGGLNFDQSTYWSLGSTPFNSPQYIHADLREGASINGNFYLATDGYLVKSSDGLNWERLNNEMGVREYYNLGLSQGNHFKTIVGSQDNGTSIKVEDGWLEFYGADGMEGFIHPLNSNWMIGSFQNGGRRRTLDGGYTQSGVTPNNQSGYWIAPMFFDPNDHMTVYSLGENIHKSEDFGDTWTQLGSPSFSGTIRFASIAENNSQIMVVSKGSSIEKSIDGGNTFIDIRGTLPGYSITDVAFDPSNDNIFIVTYARYQNDGNKVFITYDGGSTWENITYNLGDMPCLSVVIDHTPERNIYIGAEIGVFTKTMSSNAWNLFNENLPNASVRELEVMYGSNTIRAAGWGRGLWETSLVGRETYPAILKTEITDLPTDDVPKEGVNQHVTSLISYGSALSEVFVEWSVNGAAFDQMIAMSNTQDSTWVSDTPFPEFPAGDKIFFRVKAIGQNGDTTVTYKFMYEVHPFEYCSATGTNGTTADYIDYVSLEEIDQPSDQEYYADFTSQVANLYRDSTYTLQIDLNFHWEQDTTYGWIDFNKNAIFDASELIVMSQLNGNHESFGTFTVPGNAVLDTLRMRVRSRYWDGGPDPCIDAVGEVEDYSVVIHQGCAITYSTTYDSTCTQYTWNGQTFSISDTYTATFTNSAGCDSIATLYLEVEPVDVDVMQNGSELSSSLGYGDFQWLDCDDNFEEIHSALSSTYTAAENGNYALQISHLGCVDTSNCFSVLITDILSSKEVVVEVYPNPTETIVSVSFSQDIGKHEIRLKDLNGRIVQKSFESNNSYRLDLPHAKGVYWFEIIGQDFHSIRKLLIW